MDIYSYLNSRDVAEHCRKINKTWNPFEMAVIIGRSCRPAKDKRGAWRELIENYPDMSVCRGLELNTENLNLLRTRQDFTDYNDIIFDSIHQKLIEIMNGDDNTLNKYFIWFYVDIPLPFKRGDILISSTNKVNSNIFVLESLDSDTPNEIERTLKRTGCDNYMTEGWGFFVDDCGVLYGDHIHQNDNYEYYNGKLEGNNQFLHYVSLYLREEIQLPALLNMQLRIVAEHLLNNHFLINSHGRYIPEDELVENRIISEK